MNKGWSKRQNNFCKVQPRMSLSIIAIEFTNTRSATRSCINWTWSLYWKLPLVSKQEIRASFTNIVRFFYCKEDGSKILLNISMWYFLTKYYRYSMFAIFIHADVHFCLRTHPTKGENAYATQCREKRPKYN